MHLQMLGISKRFGAKLAVDGVDFEARPGEVTALLGENGAGKSTLMKLLYGLHRPDAGRILVDGEPVRIASPRDAAALRIGMVFQQFSLIPALSVRENLALALPHSPWWIGHGARRLRSVADPLRELAPEIDPRAKVADLSVGQMQLAELAKVLLLEARLMILDEPSAVLTPTEAQRLWSLMRSLCGRGLAVVLITHKLQDVHACADRVAVMRAGRLAGACDAGGLADADIVRMMIGERDLPETLHVPLAPDAPARLWIKQVCAGGLHDIDLQLRRGEIVGVAGVSGNGQTALGEAVAGLLPLEAGEVILDGDLLRAPRFAAPPGRPVGYIPEQPLRNAVAPDLSLAVNLALKRIAALPFVPRRDALQREAAVLLARHDVRPAEPQAIARTLSGGNLQKLVAARELADAPALVVACYPAMGLDIAATAQVYRALFELARQGSAVLWISEDLDDLLRYAHRIAVMLGGRVVRVLDAARTTPEELGGWMAGIAPRTDAPAEAAA